MPAEDASKVPPKNPNEISEVLPALRGFYDVNPMFAVQKLTADASARSQHVAKAHQRLGLPNQKVKAAEEEPA